MSDEKLSRRRMSKWATAAGAAGARAAGWGQSVPAPGWSYETLESVVSTLEKYIAPKLADIGVNVFEQPIAANRLTGFRELKEQGALPILMDDGVALAAALALYAAYDLKFPAALNGPQFLTGSHLKQPLTVKNGEIEVPRGPGLGVEVDESRIRK